MSARKHKAHPLARFCNIYFPRRGDFRGDAISCIVGRYSIITVKEGSGLVVGQFFVMIGKCRQELMRFSDHCSHYLSDAALKLAIVGDRTCDRDFARGVRMNAPTDELRRVNQQPC